MSSITNRSINQQINISTLVVFDSRVSDIETLSHALLQGSVGFTIDDRADGLKAITQLLATTGAKYLAIVAHGEPGVVHLGKSLLNIEQLQAHSHLLQEWGVKEIALYSCEVAKGDVGKDLIYQLSELTGATVAAAATKIGAQALDGNWNLTVATGEIVSPMLFKASILQSYQAVLSVNFRPATYFFVGSLYSITAGDLNGDGNLDLITGNNTGNDISVLLGNGVGGFGTATKFTVGGNVTSVSVGDFNRDGKLDVVTANFSSNNVSVLLNNGAGSFNATNFVVGSTPYSVAVGDFNNDRNLDLVTANNDSDNVSVLLNNGAGSFGTATNFAVGGRYPTDVTIGDFNDDGLFDLATANNSSGDVSVLLNNGAGFSAATRFSVRGNNPYSYINPTDVIVGDFNRDGKLDLVTAGNNDAVSFFLGNGAGGFDSPNIVPFYPGGKSLQVGDFNRNGKLDLVTASSNAVSNNVSVLLGNGAGVGAANNFSVRGTLPVSVALGDFNNDGRLDLVSAERDSGSISVFLNNTIPPRNDFNSDGKSDILWRNDNGDVALWQMNGSTLTTGSVFANVSTTWKIANTGDFNSDSKADILWRNNDGSVAIWQMNGYTPTTKTVIGSAPTAWTISNTGDFNGDGKSDILWRNTDGQVAIWQMNGTTPTVQTVIGSASSDWKISSTGDFNGDGKSDILWRKADGQVAMWQMNGTATISKTVFANVSTDWQIASTGDFNGDNNSDILWRNTNGQVAIWQMDMYGNMLSKDLTTPYSLIDNSWKISGTGDFNGDGKSDILWRNDNGSTNIWEMNGSTVTAANLVSPNPVVDNSWKIAAPIL
jgi:Domain of unknown function (DUF4347)/FG-GAP-like repeat